MCVNVGSEPQWCLVFPIFVNFIFVKYEEREKYVEKPVLDLASLEIEAFSTEVRTRG
jgi:hypothetical protein